MSQARFTLHGIALSGPTYKIALMLTLCGERFAYRQRRTRLWDCVSDGKCLANRDCICIRQRDCNCVVERNAWNIA